jgi:hypothetical protein
MRKLALALFLLALAGCGGDNGTTTATTASTPPPAATKIVYANGKLVGGIKTLKVPKGTHIVLDVTSDVEDEVHVHGPNIMRDVGPNAPAHVEFDVPTPGRYEVELEQRGVQIADIQVQP